MLPNPDPKVNTGTRLVSSLPHNLATPWSPDEVRALRRAATQREARRIRRSRTTARRSHVRVEYTSTLDKGSPPIELAGT